MGPYDIPEQDDFISQLRANRVWQEDNTTTSVYTSPQFILISLNTATVSLLQAPCLLSNFQQLKKKYTHTRTHIYWKSLEKYNSKFRMRDKSSVLVWRPGV